MTSALLFVALAFGADVDGGVRMRLGSAAVPKAAVDAGEEVKRKDAETPREDASAAPSRLGAPALKSPADADAGAGALPVKSVPRIVTPESLPDTPERREGLKEMREALGRFQDETKSYNGEVRGIIEAKYSERKKRLEDTFEKELKVLEAEEKRRRDDAIARFERFIKDYPDNAQYTPDVMFRLAELYFERSEAEAEVAREAYRQDVERISKAYDEQVRLFKEKKLKVEPKEPDYPQPPRKRFERTIELTQRIINKFPRFSVLDGVYYILGYCLVEQAEEKEAVEVFNELVRKYPKSKFVAEAWMRLGEQFFDSGKLKEAIDAYSRMLGFTDHILYDKALYKLAWSYYRDDDFHSAIKYFADLLDLSDKMAAEKGEAGSDMRAETVQYMAISFGEERWPCSVDLTCSAGRQCVEGYCISGVCKADGDCQEGSVCKNGQCGEQIPMSVSRAWAYAQKRLAGKPYIQEIFAKLGENLAKQNRHAEAVQAYTQVLAAYPLHPRNPLIQAALVKALESRDDKPETQALAMKERENIFDRYKQGSEWAEKNRGDTGAIEKARELVEESLITAARYHHSEGRNIKKEAEALAKAGDALADARWTKARSEYGFAAVAYEKYIERFPHSAQFYDLLFSLAECYFWSGDYDKAAAGFVRVRDTNAGEKHRADAAYNVTLALDRRIEQLVANKKMEKRGHPQQTKDGKALEGGPGPDAIPDVVMDGIKARDLFATIVPKSERVPTVGYLAAEWFFKYKHFDEARRRFERIATQHPTTVEAENAAKLIIESYRLVGNWGAGEEWARKLLAMQVSRGGSRKDLGKDLQVFYLGAKFKGGEELEKQGRFDDAAKKYLSLVAEDPKNEYAPTALFRVARNYEKLAKYESATKVYERVVNEYPKSESVDFSLHRIGVNSMLFYNVEKAIDSWRKLGTQYPGSRWQPFALAFGAQGLENNQDYPRAAEMYEKYANEYRDLDGYLKKFPEMKQAAAELPKGPAMYFRAGLVREKGKDWSGAIRTFSNFISRYGSDGAFAQPAVEAAWRIAKAYEKQGRTYDAKRGYANILKEYARQRIGHGTLPASNFAAEAKFVALEDRYQTFQVMKMAGKLKDFIKKLNAKAKVVKELDGAYEEVTRYLSVEWVLASRYRQGLLYNQFADELALAPCPTGLGPEACEEFSAQMRKRADKFEDDAIGFYTKVIDTANKFGVKSRWVKLAMETRAKVRPTEFRVVKDEKVMLETELGADVGLEVSPRTPQEGPGAKRPKEK
ncbi:MAG: tetratricopeptide repeat protein [Deltaproteobacteria bacterium]|nr:tetratricopeptide repeat protein [Deltaproteobacteria bacterium]